MLSIIMLKYTFPSSEKKMEQLKVRDDNPHCAWYWAIRLRKESKSSCEQTAAFCGGFFFEEGIMSVDVFRKLRD